MKVSKSPVNIIENLSTSQMWAIGILVTIVIAVVGWIVQTQTSYQKPLQETKTFFYSSIGAETLVNEHGVYTADNINCRPSNYSWRTDAFRCFVDNNILDPCFQEPINAEILLCPIDPTINELNILTDFSSERSVWSEEYEENKNKNQIPWFLVLETGEKCGYLGGATYAIADLRANYGCNESRTLFGNPSSNDGYWSIKCTNPNAVNTLTDCFISEAWF